MPTTLLNPSVDFQGNPADTFKGLTTQMYVKDYDPNTPLTNFSPFDPVTGQLSGAIVSQWGFIKTGYTDKKGWDEDLQLTTSKTDSGQSADLLRIDGTARNMASSISLLGVNSSVTMALQHQLPLAAVGPVGQAGWTLKPEPDITLYDRSVLMVAWDKKFGGIGYALLLPRAVVEKPNKRTYARESDTMAQFDFTAQFDSLIAAPYQPFIDGPGWRARGGVTAAPVIASATAGATGSSKAILNVTAPTVGLAPFAYNVYEDGASTPLASSAVVISGTSANPILTVTAPATGSHAFTVQAVGSNASASAQSAPVTVAVV